MITIIGASGFLGSHVMCHLLQDGQQIKAIVRNEASIEKAKNTLRYYSMPDELLNSQVEWIFADITDIHSINEALKFSEIVVNCSGFVSFNNKDKKTLFDVNITGVGNIVNSCLANSCKKLIHISSIAGIGETFSEEPITEETIFTNSSSESAYSISKYLGEQEVWRGIGEGLNAIILNPSVILGPGDWDNGSPSIFKKIDEGLNYYTNGITGYIDVRDVAKIIDLLSKEELSGERFILNESNYSYKYIFSTIATAINKPTPKKEASRFLLKSALLLLTIKSLILNQTPILTKSSVKTALKKNNYSNQKITNHLHFDFTPITETISFIARNFRTA